MSSLQQAIQRLNIRDQEETGAFRKALDQMTQHEIYAPLVQPTTIAELYILFGQLSAKQPLVGLLTFQEQPGVLLSFFQKFQAKDLNFPQGKVALRIFIRLCNQQLEENYLERLLRSKLLDNFSADRLQQLAVSYPANIKTLIDFYVQYQATLTKEECQLAFDMLMLIYPSMLDEDSPDHLLAFLKEILPYFVARFAHRMDQEELFSHTDRMVEWWMLWQRHLLQQEEALEPGDPYYSTDFSLIVKYITEYIWWNNGLIYRNGDKNFYFGSPEFCHLATGGSIRKGPDFRTYTRRMARTFATLPYDFRDYRQDMYLYFFGQSLGAGGLLQELIPEFVRHHDTLAALQEELDRWNPVVQKLATREFENLNYQQARELLGYLYHCLRDQPGFSVRGRSVEQLCRDSDAYLERIQTRAQQRQARHEARMARRVVPKVMHWKPHSRFKPLEVSDKGYTYKIIELTSEQQLLEEGSVMNHCVGSYVNRCLAGACTIWSLRQLQEGSWRSLVTLEVVRNRIIQFSARFNAVPLEEHRQLIKTWAEREKIKYQ